MSTSFAVPLLDNFICISAKATTAAWAQSGPVGMNEGRIPTAAASAGSFRSAVISLFSGGFTGLTQT
jgi:hypothetical protein